MSVLNCQRCQRVVKSHESHLDVNASTYDLISSIIPNDTNGKIYQELLSATPKIVTLPRDNAREEAKRNMRTRFETIPEDSDLPANNSSEVIDRGRTVPKWELKKTETIQEQNPGDSFILLGRSALAQSALNPYAIPPRDSNPQLNSNHNELGASILAPSKPCSTGTPRNSTFSHLITVQSKLFEQLNGKSDFQHPMCEDCYDILINSLSKKLTEAAREKAKYKEFHTAQLRPTSPLVKDHEALEKEIEELKISEQSSILTLKGLEKQLEDLKLEIKELEEENKELDIQEENYWNEINGYQLQLNQFQIERDSINAKYQHDLKQLEILHTTSVYNDLFHISQHEGIGTINGLKLGRLPPEYNTEWSEINAAWGQTVLALYTVAKKLGFEFKKYIPVPNGSYSKIEKVSEDGSKETYELFLPPDSTLSRILLFRRYDLAMVGYLNCLEQIYHYLHQQDNSFQLPYKIYHDRINNLPIQFQFQALTQWTRALRYTLRNTKTILSVVANNSVANLSKHNTKLNSSSGTSMSNCLKDW